MEKAPVSKVPGTYEKLTSGETCVCHAGIEKRKVPTKCCYFMIVVIFFALIITFLSLCYLAVELAFLQKKMDILETAVVENIKSSIIVENILGEHLKASMTKKLSHLQKGMKYVDNERNPFSLDLEHEEDDENDADDIDYNDDDDENEEDENTGVLDSERIGKPKQKREIREYEISDEKNVKAGTNKTEDKTLRTEKKASEKMPTDKILIVRTSTETYLPDKYSGYTSRERFIPATYRLSRKSHSHRKHRKSRIGSAERFFTETHSTTAAPIQVRRSRTKATESEEIDRKPWLNSNPMQLQQHKSASRDTITKEEAALKGYSKFIDDNDDNYDLDTSREKAPDALSYNMITIHFSADTSHYSRERDPHYFGNGRMQIKSEVYKDWKPAHWTQGIGMSKYFHLNQGRVTVSTTGIYLIYAQIQYSNVQEVNGFSVFRNNEVVVQCITTSTHPDKQEIKSNTCGISTTILLQSNDSVCIKDLHHGRYVVLTPEKSYFGLVLLSPFKK